MFIMTAVTSTSATINTQDMTFLLFYSNCVPSCVSTLSLSQIKAVLSKVRFRNNILSLKNDLSNVKSLISYEVVSSKQIHKPTIISKMLMDSDKTCEGMWCLSPPLDRKYSFILLNYSLLFLTKHEMLIYMWG